MTDLRKAKPKRRKPRRRKQVVPSQPNDIPFSKYRIEWVDALSDSGFVTTRLIEPQPFTVYEEDLKWKNEISFIPRLLIIVCKKFSGSN